LLDGHSLLAFPTDSQAYGRLSALLTLGNRRTEKGQCHLYKADVFKHAKGSKFIVVPPLSMNDLFDYDSAFKKDLSEYREVLGEDLFLSASRMYNGHDAKSLSRIYRLAKQLFIPVVATNDVHYHSP